MFATVAASAQRFYNLTADEVRVDSVVPTFCHAESLHGACRDSVYSVEIAYPEYAVMPASDVANYRRLVAQQPPSSPEVTVRVVYDRKRPSLMATFCPVVYRGGRYQVLVSFMLRRTSSPRVADVAARIHRLNSPYARTELARSAADDIAPADRYAAHSVLASGRWAKIRVPSTGVYQITDALVRQAGFADPSRVKVYGYGGNLQPETLSASWLVDTDDLKELPTCRIGGRRLMHALGPVSWDGNAAARRTRNYYSDYGYYFLTDDGTEPEYVDSATFVGSFYPSPYYHHSLYEVDGYSYYRGGRNLFDSHRVVAGDSMALALDVAGDSQSGQLSVNISSEGTSEVDVLLNGSRLGTLYTMQSDPLYIFGYQSSATYTIHPTADGSQQRLCLRVRSGAAVRLDYVSVAWPSAPPLANLATATLPTPQYVHTITNQDHHADPQADMVIIVPTSQRLLAQAERIKLLHEQRDAMRVNIVPADELYNEFASGTPDFAAYRRYLKMLYDRAATEADQPKYLLLFGASVWDNRLKTPECSRLSADDLLLAFESEESMDKRTCYVDDGFAGLLDDGEGASALMADKMDVAVGRIPVYTEADAKTVVDKIVAYAANADGDSWQNRLVFMGDDGDNNQHMSDADNVAEQTLAQNPALQVKKIMWDAYPMEAQASGVGYPAVTTAIKQANSQGALVMDYVGHGSELQFSHENVLHYSDFQAFANKHLPVWVTVGCDFMPFDSGGDNIGLAAMLNPNGGAVAFVGSTRTVYSSYNAMLHRPLMRHMLSRGDDGRVVSVGEALRRAKNTSTSAEFARNSRHFSLLGDPAMPLNLPAPKVVIDSIGGIGLASGQGKAQLKAGAVTTVVGHIDGMDGFEGTATLTLRDRMQTVTCRDNQGQANKPFVYNDRADILFNGRAAVSGGRFTFRFAMPKDISYSDEEGLINVFAIDKEHTMSVDGYSSAFTIGGSDIAGNDSIGPSIYCYLNTPQFQNGGNVNATPYFVAQISDPDGINASGTGIGHDMTLVVDGDPLLTYTLNDNFTFDFGEYTKGSTSYSLPELTEGAHTLTFRAWDVLNNESTATLRFNVVRGIGPSFTFACTDNPARTTTTFIVSHDRTGTPIDVGIDVYDMSGRQLWRHDESGVSTDATYTVPWDLTLDSGQQLDTGVYLYRVRLTSDGKTSTSKAKKLIVVGNK